jgi:Ca-activated chloride channel family protein
MPHRSILVLIFIITISFFFITCAPAGYDGWDAGDDGWGGNNGGYTDYGINPEVNTSEDNLSTFAVDVDTGSYTNARKHIMELGILPPPESVRAEEFVNYFDYDYILPTNDDVFKVEMEVAPSLYRSDKHLLSIGIQGKGVDQRKRANIVFLVDVSGSMDDPAKMPLVRDSLKYLVDELNQDDYVGIAVYYGDATEYLSPQLVGDGTYIKNQIDLLTPSGSTNAGAGVELAYNMASQNFVTDGINTVMMFSDGCANVGNVTTDEILQQVENYVEQQFINLSTFGYGMGEYNDTLMEQLANKGHGYYSYVDSIEEAERLFSEELLSLLHVIARDVKVQVEFNVTNVEKYRLIGYENRMIDDDDYDDEDVEGGVLGSYHDVTALYELTLYPTNQQDPNQELLIFRMNWKDEYGDDLTDAEYLYDVDDVKTNAETETSVYYRLAGDVAEFAQILRENPYVIGGNDYPNIIPTTIQDVINRADTDITSLSPPDDKFDEYLQIMQTAVTLGQ